MGWNIWNELAWNIWMELESNGKKIWIELEWKGLEYLVGAGIKWAEQMG